MDHFIFPNGDWVTANELSFFYDMPTNQEAVQHMVCQLVFENGQSGLPAWWKRRYRNAIIAVAIDDAFTHSCGVRHDALHDQWYASEDVPVGRVGYE